MIYVTQGHERGIGLEIFLKSFLLLTSSQQKKVCLITSQTAFDDNLKACGFKSSHFKNLNLDIVSDTPTGSTSSLLKVLSLIKPSDILVTLPTSKDQLNLNGQNCAGYTEFFRKYFSSKDISMCFKGIHQNVLLATDHISLAKVSTTIDENLIVNKSIQTIECFEKYFYSIEELIFSGINPHVGENGLLGSEDNVIAPAIQKLKLKYPQKNFIGPVSGDTLHMHESTSKKQLQVYMYHDQGLSTFKSKHGLIGLNVTMGLPFLRLSVDHGTAFDLYGKNSANISGMIFLFNHAFEVLRLCQSTK
jgi:4-hydroxythreonine-4-phosphate dehydrogenase